MNERVINKKFWEKHFRPDRQQSYFVIANLIMELFAPVSIVDFGCGLGWLLYYFKKRFNIDDMIGIEPCGDIKYIDSNTQLKDTVNEYIYPFSLSDSIDLGRKFDIAISFEVLEHIEEQYADVAIANIGKHSDIIVFSAAQPGQGGLAHINEQPKKYWIQKFQANGFELDTEKTTILTNSMRHYFVKPWYYNNTMIFWRKEKL